MTVFLLLVLQALLMGGVDGIVDKYECMLFYSNVEQCNASAARDCTAIQPLDAAPAQSHLHIVSIGHHGFGNELFQHTFALMLARHVGVPWSQVYLTKQTVVRSDGGTGRKSYIDTNTDQSSRAIETLTAHTRGALVYKDPAALPGFCSPENPNALYFPLSANVTPDVYRTIVDPKVRTPRCLILWGFFQHTHAYRPPFLCPEVLSTWNSALASYRVDENKKRRSDSSSIMISGSSLSTIEKKNKGEENKNDVAIPISSMDMAVYLRCSFVHYDFDHPIFYATILNATRGSYEQLYVFKAPECNKVMHKHHFHSRMHTVTAMLKQDYGATIVRRVKDVTDDGDENEGPGKGVGALAILDDFERLTSAGQLLLPASTWATWAALLTSAKKVHLKFNRKSWPVLLPADDRFIYHDPDTHQYFGTYDAHSGEIRYPPQQQTLLEQ